MCRRAEAWIPLRACGKCTYADVVNLATNKVPLTSLGMHWQSSGQFGRSCLLVTRRDRATRADATSRSGLMGSGRLSGLVVLEADSRHRGVKGLQPLDEEPVDDEGGAARRLKLGVRLRVPLGPESMHHSVPSLIELPQIANEGGLGLQVVPQEVLVLDDQCVEGAVCLEERTKK